MFVTKKNLLAGLVLGLASNVVFAQYGTSDDYGFGRFLSENPDLKQERGLHVDVPYERGEAVFKGRKDYPKLSYCVVNNGEKVKIKRKAMYPYKQGTYTDLSESLYNCDKPDSKIINELERNDFIHVLYYLDVKYKLDLKRQ